MTEQIMELARRMCGAEEEDPLLETLCRAAERSWTARLREGIALTDCGEAFLCAAAFTAAADHLAGLRAERVDSFTAGEISIKKQNGGEREAQAMRRIAERLMAPYAAEDGFVFKGVRG